jgi:diguanylate cyclase (GGDEF)-like protein
MNGARTDLFNDAREQAPTRRPLPVPAPVLPPALYQRVARITSYVFIIGVLLVVTVFGGPPNPSVYALLTVGLLLTVLFQELLPAGALGRWRLPIEALVAIVFLSALVMLTGGEESPYFFGYALLLFAGWLSGAGLGAAILTAVATAAYLGAVLVSSGPTISSPATLQWIAFNLVAFVLVSYVAAVIGREQRRARDEALRLSRHDSLTGLPNRDYFESAIEQEIQRAARTGRHFGLLMTDLDGLKAANDRFGHAAGDRLIQAVADVLRGDIRITDLGARYAGDEFVLLLPETDLAGALRVAEKVRVDIARLALPHEGSLIRTSASIGLVTYPDDGRTTAELMRRADLAMYEGKRRGKDQIVRYARQVSVPMGPPGTAVSPPSPTYQQRQATNLSVQADAGYTPRQSPPAPGVPPATPGPAPWERVNSRSPGNAM